MTISGAAERVEDRVLMSVAPIDGTGNNLQHPEWGSTNEKLLRLAKVEYGDTISSVGGTDRPGARMISNTLSDGHGLDVISDRMMSAMIYAWGQFIDHDMTMTQSGATEKMSIPVPMGDPSFDPMSTGSKTIDTMRSAFHPATGTSAANPRQQVNEITAFLDASMVYGADAETAAALRTLSGGRLKTSEGNMLPLNNVTTFSAGQLPMANENPFVSNEQLFAAGDVRANENVELTALHTLFVREHNLQAGKIAGANSSLSDEQVYQMARAIVIAEIQVITYNEWLPSLLGQGSLTPYRGYKPNVNPDISNEFATAAFRFGHSLLGDDVKFLDNNGLETRDAVPLSHAFFNPTLMAETGIDPVLKYLSADPSSEVDTLIVDSVRNFLFGPPGSGGLDLASLNIQRGRDHGLADYNDTRAAIGLPRVKSFAQITSNKVMQEKLQSLYGTVDRIDLWVGGLAEDHVKGSSVGMTFQRILADQFQRLRDGDRCWYQNQFSGPKLRTLQQTSLSEIVARNTSLTSVQRNAFIFKAGISGKIVLDINRDGKLTSGEPGVSHVQVQLINSEDGSVVDSLKSDPRGMYAFDVRDGLRTGVYQV
ncbi:MAG: peroxidase family protein, partial [Planctomycetota bacterium]